MKLLALFCLIPALAGAQITGPTVVKGKVTDAVTGEPLPIVAVVFLKTITGTTTDTLGNFYLTGKKFSNKIQVSCLGYQTEEIPILTGQTQTVEVKLRPQTKQLNEVVVKPQKKRYRNKDNPAVTLINQVILHKTLNRKEQLSSFRYEKYEKTQFALSNLTPEFKNRKYLRKFKFIFNNVDSTKIPGKEILTLYMKETLSDFYSRRDPRAQQEVIKASKMVTFEGYLNNQGMTEYLKYMYQDIDIYKNDITFLTNIFLSPIAVTAPTFYRFFIMDTVNVGSTRCFKMLFAPRNRTDMLFQGYLYITTDSSYAVKKIEISVPAEINLNWAKDVKVVQEFDNIDSQGWMLTDDFIGIDFGLTKNGVGIYGERAVSFRDIHLNIPLPDKLFLPDNPFQTDSASRRDNAYWEFHRHKPLTNSENGTYAMMDSVKKVPVFKSMMNIMLLLFAGYRDLGYFEFGPVNTFYSYNPIEGYRLRFGGRTTDALSKRYMLESYVAYAFRDRLPKYYLSGTLSLTKKSIWEFPVKSIRLSYQDETKIPGQELQFIQEDNFLLSIKRGVNNKLLYNQTLRLEHLNEFRSHFSYTLAYQFMRQRAGGGLYFNNEDYLQKVNITHHLDISELSLSLRYAREESFYQGKQYRIPMANKYPVTQLTVTWGSKMVGNPYDYLNIKLNVTKRFYLSVAGYMDAVFEAGKIVGQVPYPLLFIHRANQTYSYQINSYNLMNFLEFVSDEYVSLHLDQNFNGFFFNKIPLLKKLKWRECVSAKVLYGRLTPENDPGKHPELFKLPVDDLGVPRTFSLQSRPYVEVSAGVGNILKLFRIEFVKRLTYLDNPGVSGFGIRARFKFDF
ncbi:MAG TPA: DUF5686 family protein [Bacteroidales bacterium]|nr:DUF5686 family protein [Bacteroidales bacterium]